MSNSGIKKSHKRLLIFLSIAIITAGGVFMFSMLGKSQEERRNREYEVSLVETLKDSYEGIEKISFSNANYTNPPGSWTCVVELFYNEKSIKYKINYSKKDKRISDISLERENKKEDRDFLNSHLGKTNKLTKVVYSDGSEGEY
jgi:flagellar basal body-associated protein FliL